MTTFPYNRNVPNAPDDPADDQPEMLKNTQSTDDIIAEDHVSFTKANGGYHKIIHLVAQGAGAIPLPASSLGYLWSRTDHSYTGNEDLWFRGGGLAAGAAGEIQMTLPFKPDSGTVVTPNDPGPPTGGSQGYSFLPGGILIQWGSTALGLSSSSSVVFNKTYNATPPLILLTPFFYSSQTVNNIFYYISASSATGFTMLGRISASALTNKFYFNWLAIGQALPPT